MEREIRRLKLPKIEENRAEARKAAYFLEESGIAGAILGFQRNFLENNGNPRTELNVSETSVRTSASLILEWERIHDRPSSLQFRVNAGRNEDRELYLSAQLSRIEPRKGNERITFLKTILYPHSREIEFAGIIPGEQKERYVRWLTTRILDPDLIGPYM